MRVTQSLASLCESERPFVADYKCASGALNELALKLADQIAERVVPAKNVGGRPRYDGVILCGHINEAYHSNGICRKCYYRTRYEKERITVAENTCRLLSHSERLRLWAQPIPEGMRLGWTCHIPYCGRIEHMTVCRDSGNRSHPPFRGLRPGALYLGLVAGESMHRRDIPRYEHCKARGCAFPAKRNGNGLCHHHYHFFDYKLSMLGRDLDMEDIYGTEDSAPRFYVNWFWKHDKEPLKFAHEGATSWWRQSVSQYADIGRRVEANTLHNCARKVAHPSKDEAEVALKEMLQKTARSSELLHAYQCEVCQKWHLGNSNLPHAVMASAKARMSASIPGLHRGISGLHHGKKPAKTGRGIKASQKGRWKSMVEQRIGNKRTPHDPEKRWTRDELEREADRLLGVEYNFVPESERQNGEVYELTTLAGTTIESDEDFQEDDAEFVG